MKLSDLISNKIDKIGEIAVFIDAANIEKSLQSRHWKINYRKLRSKLYSVGRIRWLGYYTAQFKLTPFRHTFLKSLESKDYCIITKPLKIIKVKNNQQIHKANFDVEIATDACLKKLVYDTIILFSGDSDFAYLLSKLKSIGKHTVVISTKHHISRELIKESNLYIDIQKLKGEIGRP
jgi:uncharacterized LabA/DUF88 family protein